MKQGEREVGNSAVRKTTLVKKNKKKKRANCVSRRSNLRRKREKVVMRESFA